MKATLIKHQVPMNKIIKILIMKKIITLINHIIQKNIEILIIILDTIIIIDIIVIIIMRIIIIIKKRKMFKRIKRKKKKLKKIKIKLKLKRKKEKNLMRLKKTIKKKPKKK